MVDDDADSRELLCIVLDRAGYEPRAAACAADALALASEFEPQVALLDIGLPGTDGYDLARLLRATPTFEHCRFIAVSGYGSPESIARSIAAGFEAHLTKPVEIGEVLAAIRGNDRQTDLAR